MRLIFLSLSYPTPWQPTAGGFNRAMVEALAREHELRVVAPVPWTRRFAARPARLRPSPAGPKGTDVEYPVYVYPPKLWRDRYGLFLWASCRRSLARVKARFAPDAFLAYWAHPDGEAALRAARKSDRACVVIVGGSDVLVLGREPRRRDAIRRVLLEADAVLAVGQRLRESVLALGVPEGRVTAFRRGVDTGLFHPGDRRHARGRLGLAADGRVVLWAGRMVPVKGLSILLEAWRQVRGGEHQRRLCFVGTGPLETKLRAMAKRLGISDTVAFVGAQPHARLPIYYRAADLTVLPSLSEGVPNVLLESLACGTPFLATDVGGVREISADPDRELVPPGDPTAFARALERCLRNPGAAALPAGFTWDACAATVTKVLAAAVRSRAGPSE